MSDIPPTDETTPPPPPPPPGAEPVDPPFYEGLRRSRSDRVIAGVAGGLGHHFGIDPVIVRIGFVLLTIFGGSGVLLYLLAWLVIAKEGNHDTSAMRALRGSPEGNRALLFVVLAVGAILILFSPLVWFDGFGIGDGLALPLLLIAAGVAFLIWPGDNDTPRRSTPTPPEAHAPPPPAPPTADGPTDPDVEDPMSTRAEIRMELRSARDEVQSELAEARDSFRQQRREWRHGYRAERRAQRHAQPPRPPKPAPFLGPLTVAVLLVFAGLAMVGEQSDWWDVDPAVYGGITLAIIGAGLITSAFLGRARGLIFLGIAVLPVAWAIAAIDLDWHDGIGEELDRPESIENLQDAYTFGIGEYDVDLSAVDYTGSDSVVEVGLTIGQLTVWVPDTVDVIIDADVRGGEIEVFTADRVITNDGIDADVDADFLGTGDGTLTLDADVGFGALDITICSPDTEVDAQSPGELVPCP